VILEGKRAWITGASGTIGGAIALRFQKEGAELFTSRVELADADAVQKAALDIRPDVLVNCAGVYGPHGPVQDGSAADWVRTIEVNLIGSFLLTRAVIPYMLGGGGKIIHLSGGGAASGRPFYSAYSASKAGLVRFVECVAEEVEKFNIQINAIAPGSVKSRMNPEGTGTPDKAVELALFLASQESNHLTGRLISAIYDDWKKPFAPEAGKLRRISL
jgi:NAD(P)-dependent dehydrogenase (short-subunit alcohol dehydrogenase family)